MEVIPVFWYVNEFVLLLVAFALFLGVIEASFRLGRQSRDHQDVDGKAHVGALQAAALVLLALLLGFTFSMAVSRFDTRKELLLDEANAIGTTVLRARFLPEVQRHEAVALLKAYVSERIAFYDAGIDQTRLEAASAAASRLEDRLWELAVSSAGADARSVPTGLFIQALNDLIDDNEKRRVALDNHVPEAVLFLLFFVSAVALGFVAYGCGLTGRRRFMMNGIFALMIAMVITIILDFDRPRRGLVQVSQDSLVRLKNSLDLPAR
jgi:hypothetical protein